MVNLWSLDLEGWDEQAVLGEVERIISDLGGRPAGTGASGLHVYIAPSCRAAAEAVLRLMEYEYTRLSVIAGNDERFFRDNLSLTYIVAFDKPGLYVGIRCYLSLDNPVAESIADRVKAAWWNERENHDLYGIVFRGLRDQRRLVLPEHWPRDVHPWRKDYPYTLSAGEWSEGKIDYQPTRCRRTLDVIGFGPYHLVNDEPIHWRLYVKGEVIVDAEHRGFHNWRGIEKIAEGRLTYNQVPFIAERICGICGYSHATAYAQAVEAIAGIDVPDRARYIRSIMLEIERLESHLLWIGIACHILGFDTGFMHSWKIREHVMHLAEILTGNRKTYGMNIVGGVRRDILGDRLTRARDTVKAMRSEYRVLYEMLVNNNILVKRTRGVGVLPRDKAISYGVVGPVARATGLDIDVRRDHPYAAYREVSFDVPVYTEGDVLAITLVRLEEVWVSLDLLDQLLDALPGGPLQAEVGDIPVDREGVGVVEAPRGEDIHYVRTGMYNKIQRWRVRAPSYANIPPVREMLIGYRLADAPIIYASIDPCLACTERYLVIDVETGKKTVVDDHYLREKSRRETRRAAG